MQQFKVRPDAFPEIRKKSLIKSIPILLIAATVGIVISIVNTKPEGGSINTLPFTIPIALCALGFGIFRGLNRQKVLLDSYTLTVTNNLITREQIHSPTISIYFDEVSEISKSGDSGFVIKGRSSTDIIYIPGQIENYSELEKSLQQIRNIGEMTRQPILQKYRGLLSMFTLALMAFVYIAKDKILVAVSGVILVIFLSWSFYEGRRSKNIDSKTKQGMWWILLVIVSVIVITISKLTGNL